ncbi:MAG: YvcK family protein [Clostridia bacterium]|nr:YvcK family protein [Clostridia bacterium]
MKRWIFLILLGMLIAFYGVAKILEGEGEGRLDFAPLAQYVVYFVVGFIFVILGMVHMQKRTLELFVQETDERVDNDAKVNSLIYNKKVYDQGPKIVAIGGGTGLNSVLKGLKNYTDNITAIVTVSDYGEIVPESRRILQAMPLDDIKESIVALAKNEEEVEKYMNYQFTERSLKDLSLGDISLLGMKNYIGDFTKSIARTSEVFNITGKVLPVTFEPIQICAELEDGSVIESRDKIPEAVSSKTTKISRIFINPTNCKVAPGVLDAIREADAIIIGPGSLYTNVIPNLLVKGVAKAIKDSKAFKVYVSNLMTEPGQTDAYTLSDHIKAIIDHAGKGIIEYCIYDTGELVPEYIRKYNMQGQDLVEIDSTKTKALGANLMQREISYVQDGYIRHNPDAIAASIIQLICDDLKFRDMQNDTKYVLLNDRLKTAKKSLKESDTSFRKEKRRPERGESKYFQKYKDRLEAMQEAEIRMKVKNGMSFEEAQNSVIKKYIEKENDKAEAARKATESKKKGSKAKTSSTSSKSKSGTAKKTSSSKNTKTTSKTTSKSKSKKEDNDFMDLASKLLTQKGHNKNRRKQGKRLKTSKH